MPATEFAQARETTGEEGMLFEGRRGSPTSGFLTTLWSEDYLFMVG